MALVNSKEAIGSVSSLLQSRLIGSTSVTEVTVGQLEKAAKQNLDDKKSFNLFLYQVDIDASLRNIPLDTGQVPPVWLVLRYLLTAFDKDEESDSIEAHKLLGEGMLALQELNYIEPSSAELSDNPEPLKITFDSADADLLSKIMQGSDDKYRISTAFQVRPVMIAPTVAPSYALPVQFVGPPDINGVGKGVAVIPALGPVLESMEPDRFSIGEEIVLYGGDLAGVDKILVGDVYIPVPASARSSDVIRIEIPDTISLSAGSHLIKAVKSLPFNRENGSNAVLGHLLPVDVSVDNLTSSQDAETKTVYELTLNGKKLGADGDAVFVSLYRNGKVELMFEEFTANADQTILTVTTAVVHPLLPGEYFVILRVNGEQAKKAPPVILP